MSTKYTSFAFFGIGEIGLAIAKALLAQNASVVVLRRLSSTSDLGLPPNVKIARVDYTKPEDVAAIFRENNVEVVISTVGGLSLDEHGPYLVQNQISDAAKLADVKLFVPSEFGIPSNGRKDSVWKVKDGVAEYAKKLGIPTTRFFTGLWMIGWPQKVTGYATNGKVSIIGKGQSPWSFTAQFDIAGFVAYVLTTLPPSELHDKIIRIEGDRATLLEFAEILNAPTEFVEEIPGDDSGAMTAHSTAFENTQAWTSYSPADGKDLEGKEGNHNHLWPGHKWTTIKESLSL